MSYNSVTPATPTMYILQPAAQTIEPNLEYGVPEMCCVLLTACLHG